MRFRILILLLVLASQFWVAPAKAVLPPEAIPAAIEEILNSPVLSNPAMILIDVSTGTVVYEKNANSQRKPASVMKIFAGASVLEHLDLSMSFLTTVSLGTSPKTLIINGSFDPWFSLDAVVAKKMHRTSLPRIAFNSINALKRANSGSLKDIKVMYSGLFTKDVTDLRAFWAKRGFKPTMKAVSSDVAMASAQTKVLDSLSPPVLEILNFTILNSDNLLAERLARLASKAAGHPFNNMGVAVTFAELLERFDIDSSKLITIDASGLSKGNRVTAKVMGQLLFSLRKDEKFAPLYQALPVAGISGTLRNRFISTAPNAIGIVHAKTGTLNGTVTLAGYIESAEHEYAFVTFADQIPKGERASDKARAAIDRLLGRIATPNIPTEISEAPVTP